MKIRNKLNNLFISIKSNYKSFVWFVGKLIFWTFVLVVLAPLLASLFASIFKKSVSPDSFILFITAAFIIAYTYETQKMREQMKESDLRPVILRSGWIAKWEDIKFSTENGQLEGIPLQFMILKNIAKDISGYIIIDKKKYKLLFANEISQVNEKDSSVLLSDLEKRIMLHLYEEYERTKINPRWRILDAYRELGIKEGSYAGILNSSKYIKTTGEEFQLADEGIRLMDNEKPKAFQFLPSWGWMKANTIINAIYQESEFEMTREENSIYLSYQDIGDNKYFTKENKNFSQNSGKL